MSLGDWLRGGATGGAEGGREEGRDRGREEACFMCVRD